MGTKGPELSGTCLLWILVAQFLGATTFDKFQDLKNTQSRLCQLTFDNCKKEFVSSEKLYAKRSYCMFLHSRENHVTMHQCLVLNGFCTDREYNALAEQACGYSDRIPINSVRQAFYSAVSGTSKDCQLQMLQCVRQSFIATVALQTKHYCHLLNATIHHKECLAISSRCSAAEVREMETVACEESQHGALTSFSDVLAARDEPCQRTIEDCITNSDSAIASAQSQSYYALMNDSGGGEQLSTCVTRSGQCTWSDVMEMALAACRGSHLVHKKRMLLTLPWLYVLLQNL